MKRKILIIVLFVVSSFFMLTDVKANYKAYANNGASGAKCSLEPKSTGYCFYANTKLNSVESHVKWLDNGDEVTVSTSKQPIKHSSCKGSYVYVTYYHSGYNASYSGYYCDTYLITSNISESMKAEFREAGFPESYWAKLAVLKTAHPNWKFNAVKTGLNFKDAVSNENIGSRSLIQGASSNDYAYLALDYGAFDYKNNRYIAYDNTNATWSNRWFRANYATIAYYVDPRNFLNDMYIFQFERLSYDNSISDERLTKIINSALSGDYIAKFTNYFIKAGKESGVNPIYLAALSKQEVGVGKNPNVAVDGKYNGMYNFYNIGATGGANPALNGLEFAKNTDASTLRPWNTEQKAIVGGAKWISTKYISVGQDTSYFKKWNVVYNYLKSIGKTPTYSNYTHQYMTNIQAPTSEANTTYRSYYDNNLLSLDLIFNIPVYNNMPATTTLPTKTGWPNNYLKDLIINGKSVAGFDGDVTTYNYYLNTPTLKLQATPVDSSEKISGLGTFTITNDCTKTITVTADNGDIRKYNINIKLTSEAIEAVDVVTTLNKAGVKNGTYITGIKVGTNINTLTNKIKGANSNAVVKTMNANGTSKSKGVIVTGDKLTITVGKETKTYSIVIYGDVNGDGKISAVDYVKIKNHIMRKGTLQGAYRESADIDKNGHIKATDYVKVKNYIMGTGKISQ